MRFIQERKLRARTVERPNSRVVQLDLNDEITVGLNELSITTLRIFGIGD